MRTFAATAALLLALGTQAWGQGSELQGDTAQRRQRAAYRLKRDKAAYKQWKKSTGKRSKTAEAKIKAEKKAAKK